jgi:hypothetical protein
VAEAVEAVVEGQYLTNRVDLKNLFSW